MILNHRLFGQSLRGFLQVRLGLVEAAERLVAEAQVVVGLQIAGVELEGVEEALHGRRVLPVVVVQAGRPIGIERVLRSAEGEPAEVRANPRVVEAYLGKQG